jgi:type II secretory pathway predicted ATPase ExeA
MSLMYESYFGFRRRPFPPIADLRTYVPIDSFEAARANLLRCLMRGEGISMLVGPTGGGKTLMLRLIEHQLRSHFPIVHLAHGRLRSASQFFEMVLLALGQPIATREEAPLRRQLHEWLQQNEREAALLLIDDAHLLPMSILEEIRLLTNLDNGSSPQVRVLLGGSSRLEEHLTHPRLDSFNQRVVMRGYLEMLSREETGIYLSRQLAVVDHPRKSTLFDPSAQKAIHQATGGIPRLINQLCDHVLLLACERQQPRIDEKLVQQAWASLQQLPPPEEENASLPCAHDEAENVIEFGSLEDDDFEDLPPRTDSSEAETKTASFPVVSEPVEAQEDSPSHASLEEAHETIKEPAPPCAFPGAETHTPIDEPFDEEETVSRESKSLDDEFGHLQLQKQTPRDTEFTDSREETAPGDETEDAFTESYEEVFPSLTCEKAMQELSDLESAVSREIEMIKELEEGSFIDSLKYPFQEEDDLEESVAEKEGTDKPESGDSKREKLSSSQDEEDVSPVSEDESMPTEKKENVSKADGAHSLSPPHFLDRPLPRQPSLDSLFTRLREKRE